MNLMCKSKFFACLLNMSHNIKVSWFFKMTLSIFTVLSVHLWVVWVEQVADLLIVEELHLNKDQPCGCCSRCFPGDLSLENEHHSSPYYSFRFQKLERTLEQTPCPFWHCPEVKFWILILETSSDKSCKI